MAKLLQFTIGNFRSFNRERTFTFAPTSIQDEPKESVASIRKYRFSTISAVYGANSSGKSNLTNALYMMGYIVNHSVRLNDNDELSYDPFALSSSNAPGMPMHFEVVYIDVDGTRVRYGFENNASRIVKEWLFIERRSTEVAMFVRDEEGIAVNGDAFPEGVDREEMTNDNRLYLSLVAQLGGPVSKNVLSFFRSGMIVISGLDTRKYRAYTKFQFIDDTEISVEAMRLFERLQLGFTKIEVEENEDIERRVRADFSPGRPTSRADVFSSHNVYDDEGNITGDHRFRFSDIESNGTHKIFELAGPIFDTLLRGAILVIDELDAKMHPLIAQQIVRLFIDKETNPLNAQLLFSTHDTNLLSAKLLRRDQIWFTEKDNVEATDLYRLTDIVLPDGTKPRGDGNLERNYIKGRYGAIPFITW